MKQTHANYNHARWIAICPHCAQDGKTAALEVQPGDVFICPECHPQVLAKTLLPNPRMAGAFNSVPDVAARDEARQSALALGDCYEVIFPAEKAQIEKALRMRPAHARNWFPGVSLQDIQDENRERGLINA